MVGRSPWEIRGYKARVSTPTWRASVDLRKPQLGLIDVQVRGALLTHCQLMQLIVPGVRADLTQEEPLDEAYLRGDDLIVHYGQASGRAIRPQAYWRLLRDPHVLGAVELVVAAQTPLLDSDPSTSILNRWHHATLWRLLDPALELFEPLEPINGQQLELLAGEGSSLFLLQPDNSGVSVAVAVHPSDLDSAELGPCAVHGGHLLTLRMFPDHLEKGVIRKGRIRCWLLPRVGDMSLACQSYAHFLKSPLPLTT